jgi:hypothetical protein
MLATSGVANWPVSDQVFLDTWSRALVLNRYSTPIALTCQNALLPGLRRLDVQNRMVTADRSTDTRQEGAGRVGIDSGGSTAERDSTVHDLKCAPGAIVVRQFSARRHVGHHFHAEPPGRPKTNQRQIVDPVRPNGTLVRKEKDSGAGGSTATATTP